MVNVLKTREDLAYQLALHTTELTEIFANAPSTPQSASDVPSGSTDTGGSRKPIEGDCPVCVMEFEKGDDVVWCKAACGNNIHRQCFEQWAKSKAGQVKCVFCRTPWIGDEDSIKRISKGGNGAVNRVSERGPKQTLADAFFQALNRSTECLLRFSTCLNYHSSTDVDKGDIIGRLRQRCRSTRAFDASRHEHLSSILGSQTIR